MPDSTTSDKPSYTDLTQRVNELEEMVARHQRTEAKLLQDGGDFQKLAEMLPEAVYEADSGANLTYLNQNGRRQFGYRYKKSIRRLTTFDLISIEDQPLARENFKRIISDRQTDNNPADNAQFCNTHTAVRRNGETFPTLFLCTPLVKNGKIIGVRGFIRDISACRQAKQALDESRDELEKKSVRLEEANLALNVLLKQHEKNKNDLAKDVIENVDTLIFPHIDQIKKNGLSDDQEKKLNVLETNLRNLVSPFARTLSSRFYRLTPTEIRIANLIKQGKTTKEIAGLMGVASSTIDTHRNHIREKLRLKSRQINLRSFLKTLR